MPLSEAKLLRLASKRGPRSAISLISQAASAASASDRSRVILSGSKTRDEKMSKKSGVRTSPNSQQASITPSQNRLNRLGIGGHVTPVFLFSQRNSAAACPRSGGQLHAPTKAGIRAIGFSSPWPL